MRDKHTTTHRPETNNGRFRKGNDPRRHKFTREECQAGFWAALESVTIRYPAAVNARGHIALNFLPAVLRKRSGKEGANR